MVHKVLKNNYKISIYKICKIWISKSNTTHANIKNHKNTVIGKNEQNAFAVPPC